MTLTDTAAPTSAVATSHWTGADSDARWIVEGRTLARELALAAADHDRTGRFVADAFNMLRARGLLTMLIPLELGGGGTTHAEASGVLSELARGCPSTALTLSMHTHLVAAQVWRHKHGLAAPLLKRVVDEQLVLVSTGAFDWIDSNGTSVRADNGYRVTARKAPASGCPIGDVMVTSFCYVGDDGAQVVHASVPFGADGVSMEATWDAMGMRATGSDTIVLTDVFVPDTSVSLTRPAGQWHPVWSAVLGAAMPLIMSCYVGVAQEAAARAIGLAARRVDRPDTAPLVGRMLNRLTATQDVVRAMIDASDDLRFDNTLDHASGSLTRRTIAAEGAIDTVRVALEVGGGSAYAVSSGIERLFRDVHGALYHVLTPMKQERFSGRHALGLDPNAV
jgi:alkylation response protein AidB-like acyl-CoA dehydrogenase